MNRTALASWTGSLRDGKGSVSTQSGVLKNTNFVFKSRFEGEPSTNPEELIAAAHACCFTMAVSSQLGQVGMTADHLASTATVTLENTDGGLSITTVRLDLVGKIPGADKTRSKLQS